MISKLFPLLAAVIVSSVEATVIPEGNGECEGQSKSYRSDLVSGVSNTVRGTVHFTQKCRDGPVTVTAQISGLTPNSQHGFHVHELPNLTRNCSGAGGHFNPLNRTHGAQTNSEDSRHVGDLGNIMANSRGIASFRIVDNLITLHPGVRSIARRAIVVHSNQDDLGMGNNAASLITGNAGRRLACGVIAPAPSPSPASSPSPQKILIIG